MTTKRPVVFVCVILKKKIVLKAVNIWIEINRTLVVAQFWHEQKCREGKGAIKSNRLPELCQ